MRKREKEMKSLRFHCGYCMQGFNHERTQTTVSLILSIMCSAGLMIVSHVYIQHAGTARRVFVPVICVLSSEITRFIPFCPCAR